MSMKSNNCREIAHCSLLVFSVLACWAAGCNNLADLYGLSSPNSNPNTDDSPPPEGTVRLSPVTFSLASGFPQGSDPASFDIGGGTITASGGSAGTLGQTGLYADDLFAWDFRPGATGLFDLTGLEVVAIDGYWVQPSGQAGTATMTLNFSDDTTETIEAVAVNANGSPGQSGGFFDTVSAPEGETIDSLSFEFDDAADSADVAALDVLELTVRE